MIKLWFAATLLAVLSACGGTEARAAEGPPFAVVQAQHAWAEAGLPGSGECLDHIEIHYHKTVRSFVDSCEGAIRDFFENLPGCVQLEMHGDQQWFVFHLAPGAHDNAELLRHQTLHALTQCYLRRDSGDEWDARHSDQRVFGSKQSVQVRARSIKP